MNKKRLFLILVPFIVIGIILGYSYTMGIPVDTSDPSLEFPIIESDRIERFSAYHTPDWGEPGVFHNGIDLVISDNVTVVSPVDGTIVSYVENINSYGGNVLFDIGIAVNWAWEVHLVLEPGFMDAENNSLQSSNIALSIGQRVSPGDELGTLLYSENYPHLHYMLLNFGSDVCTYNYSTSGAQTIFEDIAADSNSTILFPYPAPNLIMSPVVVAIVGGSAIYLFIVLIVFKFRK
ncbi:MAG: M23 family metallopeptidase [Candidatus Thorarchaeota archaeon]